MRTYPLLSLALLALAWPLSASAQSTASFDLSTFRPAPTTEDGLALTLPRTLGHLRAGGSLTLDYAHQPLVLSEANKNANGAIVKHRLMGHLMGAIGIGERFEVFLYAPLTLVQRGDQPRIGGITFPDPSKAAFGALTVGGSARVVGEDLDPFQVGVQASLTLPTGSARALSGDDGVAAEVRATTVYQREKWSFAGNLGGRYRPSADYGSAKVGSEILFGAGAYYRIVEKLTAMAEWYGGTTTRSGQAFTSKGTPSEMLFGARWTTPLSVVLTGAVGVGLTQAVGVPDTRVLLQAGYPPPRPPLAPPDRDKDGVLDDKDNCPDIPEDSDGFQDEDGCPDPDNDADGIADVKDQCPSDPEDIDGFQDQDGCPDPDNDHDGLLDPQDKCPNAAEDKDGVADEDGCPDLDNDKDGIPDERDQCPMDPEDLDGFADEDGCPDPDNDKDGIPDERDNCPTVPGPEHTKGCPSAVRIDRSQIRILQRIEFETNRAEIRPESLGIIDQVRSALEVNPQLRKIRIEGHTDDRGSNERNQKLSQHRAEAVMKYLVDEGIDPARLEAKGWGEDHPLVPNDSEANWQTNRRVEFHIVDPAPPAESADQPLESSTPKPSAEPKPETPAPAASEPSKPSNDDVDWGGVL